MKSLHTFATALLLGVGLAASASAATPGVRDAANMFSAEACRRADEKLAAVHRSHGWEIVVETIDSLGSKTVDRLAEDKARSLQVKGVYLLIAEKERKISIQVFSQAAMRVFDESVREAVREKILTAFKAKQFDRGLLDGVSYLEQVAVERAGAAAAQGAPARPANEPQAVRGPGSFLVTVLIVAAVIIGVLLLVRLISAAARGGAGGWGGPAYGGGGGGFWGSLFGAMGGVFLGNWLYNTFSGGHAHAGDSSTGPSDANTTGAFDDHHESTSGEWEDGGATDDTGGDFGGGDDLGGGDFGGGDLGGGDMGGGDW